MEIKEYILLKDFSNYRIGGPARYFCEVENEDDLQEAVNFANNNHLQIFILGGGTNLLISDNGFNGLVIKILNSTFQILNSTARVGAGMAMSELVAKTVGAGLAGLEWAGGLPGTVGGAVFGNAGCFGWEMKNVIKSVWAVNIKNYSLQSASWRTHYKLDDCAFSYRSSKFKREGGWVILSVTLQFQKGKREELHKTMEKKVMYRKTRHPLEYPNIGSIFKNIDEKEKIENIVRQYPEFKEGMETKWFGKLPAAVLIQKAGLQGKEVGGAQVSIKHANFIINKDNAKSQDVATLIKNVKSTVKEAFTIELEEEVRYVGFNTLENTR